MATGKNQMEKQLSVGSAVEIAKRHVQELFHDENLSNLGLEEIEFDDDNKEWVVTVGFSRPWDEPKNAFAALAKSTSAPLRSFKVVRIDDLTQQVVSVKNREVPG